MNWLFILSSRWLFLSVGALTWRPSLAPKVSNHLSDLSDDKSGLTPSEIDALFLHVEALDTYSRKPDCFRRAAGRVRAHCSELDMDEDARVKAAIQMTLCELATARHHSLPLECSMFSDALESVPSASQGNCVEALSRSAQFWSSYSGYLREVPQLCYAFRRWNDIDTARDIYKNATLEKLALIQIINKREDAALESLNVVNAHLEEMRIILGNIRETGISIGLASEGISVRFADGFKHTVGLLNDAVSTIQRQGQENLLTVVSQVDAALGQVVERHTVSLMSFLPVLSASIKSNLDDVSLFVRQQNENTLEVANEVDRIWRTLTASLVNMHRSVSNLVHATTSATEALLLHTNNAIAAHALQNDTNHAATELGDVISQLRDVVHTELEWINGTGSEIRRKMVGWDRADWGWCWELIVWVTRVAWRVDLSAIDLISRSTSFRFIVFTVGIFHRLFQAIVSSWMSCFFVLLISSRKRLSRMTFDSSSNAASSDDPSPRIVSRSRPLNSGVRMQFHNSTSNYHYSDISRIHRISRIPDRLCIPQHL